MHKDSLICILLGILPIQIRREPLRPTPIQQRAFELLGINADRTQ